MGTKGKSEGDPEPRVVVWISTIQLIIRGILDIILELVSRGRSPF
jgi:hypothetical protein